MSGEDDTTTYPNLGFNPAPGLPSDVDGLNSALQKTTSSMQEAGTMLNQMRDSGSGVWVGSAGDAFRSHFDDKIVGQLNNAHESLGNAVGVMQDWFKDLTGYKDSASKLDQEAGAAKEALAKAKSDVGNAQNSPAFQLIGKQFQEGPELQQAQNAINEAESVLSDARNAESSATEQLNSVLTRAKQLGEEAENSARGYASKLDDATKGLAPSKPGMFSSMWHSFTGALSAVGGWIEKHASTIHSILSTISGIAGLIALVTPPPIDAIAAGVALVAGIGAVAMDAANPATRSAIAGIFTGHESMSNWKALAGVGLDIASAIPGVGALAKGVKGADEAATSAADIAKVADEGVKSIPSLASKIPGLSKIGGDATDAFAQLAGKSGAVGDIERSMSASAHSVSGVISGAVGIGTKIANIGRDADSALKVSQATLQNINVVEKAGSVAHSLYGDVKSAF